MSRHVILLAGGLWLSAFAPAVAQNQGGQASGSMDAELRAAETRAAIAACDKGAAVPLDREGTQPPIQFSELLGYNLDVEALKKVAANCRKAVAGAPSEKRLKLQLLRVEWALGERDPAPAARELRLLAAAGSAEANYLLFDVYRSTRSAESGPAVTREDGLAGLRKAAQPGHQEALVTAVYEFLSGPHVKRDAKEAARLALFLKDLPQQGATPGASEAEARKVGVLLYAKTLVTADGFSDEERARGFAIVKELYDANDAEAFVPYIAALRYGRGVTQDAARARELLEAAVARNLPEAFPLLAGMLANGEGGPADGKRALTLLQAEPAKRTFGTKKLLAELLLDNRYIGPRPREAMQLMRTADLDMQIRLAGLLIDYDERLEVPEMFLRNLQDAAEVGEPGAAMALARLKLSDHPQFGSDDEGARAILIRLKDQGDAEAAVLLAETQYGDLSDSSFQPYRREGGLTDDEIRKLIDDGIAAGQASAFRLKAKLLRVGLLFPQDDGAATSLLLEAAQRGDVEAMLLLGEAYSDGLGIAENKRERVRWWREAARQGSIEATENLADAFVFDSFDKLLTLREGVTERLALYHNSGPPDSFGGMSIMRLSSTFSGSRHLEAGVAAMAAATMDSFRRAPAGLADAKLVPLMRELPEEIRVEIERALKSEGFYKGEPQGFFGPEVRAALAAWVDAKGPLPDEAAPAPAMTAVAPATSLPADLLDRVRDRAFTLAMNSKTDKEREEAVAMLNMLARHGDPASRFALMRNYHTAQVVRDAVTPEEITRYGLDIIVTRPDGMEKVDFEFIFDVTAIMQQGKIDAFGTAFLDALRDDARLQDPLTLGGVMQQLMFAPGGCDAIAEAARKAGIDGIGPDGCEEAARAALIAFAKEKGPAGIEPAAREAAVAEIEQIDAAEGP